MPWVRRRLVWAKVLSSFLEKPPSASAVASWTSASGFEATTALITASRSSRSSATGSAPSAFRRAAFSGDRAVPITSCRAWISWGTSRVPMAPLAPATKTRIMSSFRSHQRDFAGLVV